MVDYMRAVLFILFAASSQAGEPYGVWKVNPTHSTPAENRKSVTLRIESHAQGEVFTLDTVAPDGRASTSSTILYFDGKARDFQDAGCSGTQSSRRVDGRTIEILRDCGTGRQIRLVRRMTPQGVLIFEVFEQFPGGRHSERRLLMKKE